MAWRKKSSPIRPVVIFSFRSKGGRKGGLAVFVRHPESVLTTLRDAESYPS